jgi:hypothetical protein
MDTVRTQLQALLAQARTWENRIKKTTYADSVEFIPNPTTGEFTIVTRWVTRAGDNRAHSKTLTRDYIFGPAAYNKVNPSMRRTLCAFMREYMQEVLHSRGVA